ncbi:glycosyltransferase family 4 protein [Paenibacillus aceris]|uniref:Spore coat protein SA n=1 Tax=Paenibacillus aceris TaxID=869555 RepID=A0ABS4I7Q7_9BACL|nr:glycosyltransferase family 4 protein [Paenibacillus aceris]MBP1966962.1 spore coat protein SA [Paenibacillus aceris]NHW39326.1 glycosyltransferase family 4 protein [Paenibacillus aceris]
MCSLPIKVAIVTPGTFPIPSGTSSSVEMVVYHTAKQLVKHMGVYVLGRKTLHQPSREMKEGVHYLRVRYEKPASYIERVSQQINLVKPAFIQVENRPRFVRYLRRKHPGVKISLMLHSTSFISGPHISVRELSACLRAANIIVVNSDFLKRLIQRKVPSCSHKIVTQHLGADLTQFTSKWTPEGSASGMALLKELGYEDKKIILFVGRLIPKKGVHHLLDAMLQVVQTEPNAILLIVGSAYYGKEAQTDYVRKLHRMGSSMPQYVRFIPYVSHNDIAKWYQSADIVAVPSAPNEAFGLVNVEAMATGVPVVATRSGGIQEVVDHGTTGYLVDSNQIAEELPRYLLRLLGDAELRRVMGEQGLQRVRHMFTWERSAEQWFERYQSMRRRTPR